MLMQGVQLLLLLLLLLQAQLFDTCGIDELVSCSTTAGAAQHPAALKHCSLRDVPLACVLSEEVYTPD
jgi:hypothetical protein